jgi:hypothetical protein
MPNRRNQYDHRDCLERSEGAEAQFARIGLSHGWKVEAANARQDIDEHWDVMIEKGAERHWVDVKAMKRINRRDAQPQDVWVWIELQGVREGEAGWLFGGKADWIAFERTQSFVIVPRVALATLIPKIVDFQSKVSVPKAAKYKVYRRAGRPDRITLIESAQLDKIKVAEWEKLPKE